VAFGCAVALGVVLQAAWAQPVPATSGADELRSVFQQLLLDPGNPALNLRYAALTAQRGEIARAIATYERILIDDPNNVTARRELTRLRLLLDPPTTEAVLSLGVQYESNAPRRNPSFLTFNDTVGTASLAVRDERVLGDRRWRSFGTAFMNVHNRFSVGDLGYVGANTGPLLMLPGGWTMRPGLGGAFASRDYRTMFAEGSLLANFETMEAGPLEQINLRFAGQDWSGRDPGKDALIGEIGAGFRWRGIAASGDTVSFDPIFTYNAADTADNTYRAINLTFGYVVPMASFGPVEARSFFGRSYLGLELHLERDDYGAADRRISPPAEDRRDYYVAPGIRLVTPAVIGLNETWTLRYLFEDNISNEFINRYSNHTIGLTASWRL